MALVVQVAAVLMVLALAVLEPLIKDLMVVTVVHPLLAQVAVAVAQVKQVMTLHLVLVVTGVTVLRQRLQAHQ